MRTGYITSAVDLLWRGVAVFRIGAVAYAGILFATGAGRDEYQRPGLGVAVVAGMVAWTAFTVWAYARPARRTGWLLGIDLVMALASVGASHWVQGPDRLSSGVAPLPLAWIAAPVLAWAIHYGRRAGAIAALLAGATDAVVRGWPGDAVPPQVSINATVLLLLAGVIMGYVSRLAGEAQRQLQQAAEREAAIRERERLARGIHDSVLQVLALVQRRGAELGGEAAQLGRLAGEQEATLRALVAGDGAPGSAVPGSAVPGSAMAESAVPGSAVPGDDAADLRTLLNQYASTGVTIAAPAVPVWLPAPAAGELAAAVGSALDNVRVHCGSHAPAWVLIEAEPDAITITVRDDGPGMPPARLAQAAAEGRLGVAQSIQGRMRDLGGTATVTSAPGQGTEVELRLPLT